MPKKVGLIIADLDALDSADVKRLEDLGFLVILKKPQRNLEVRATEIYVNELPSNSSER